MLRYVVSGDDYDALDGISSVKDGALREYYSKVEAEVFGIDYHWSIYTRLFGKTKRNVDLLNCGMPGVAGVIQEALLHDVVLRIARLIDGPGNDKGQNVCLCGLMERIDCRRIDKKRIKEIENQRSQLGEDAKRVRILRNKQVVHNDLAMYDDNLGVSRLEISTVQDDIIYLLNSVRLSAGLNKLCFKALRSQAYCGADALLETIQVGLYAEDLADDLFFLNKKANKWFDGISK